MFLQGRLHEHRTEHHHTWARVGPVLWSWVSTQNVFEKEQQMDSQNYGRCSESSIVFITQQGFIHHIYSHRVCAWQENKAAGIKLTFSQKVQHINTQKAALNNETSFPHTKLCFAAFKLSHVQNVAKGQQHGSGLIFCLFSLQSWTQMAYLPANISSISDDLKWGAWAPVRGAEGHRVSVKEPRRWKMLWLKLENVRGELTLHWLRRNSRWNPSRTDSNSKQEQGKIGWQTEEMQHPDADGSKRK